jgi:phosphatidylinositol-bisphosphatase
MSLTVLVGTYNLNQRLLKKDLTTWLFPQSLPEKPDIVAIGFQEFNEYPNAFLNFNNEKRIEHCEGMIEEAIFNYTKERYIKEIRSISVGLVLVIYVRDEGIERKKNKIKSIDVEQVGVGPIWAGNKGAIAARLMINDTISVCFVCAHLAPHSHNVMKRNKDFKSIIERIIFNNKSNNQRKEDITIYDNNYVFFFGDLNYRIEIETMKEEDLMNLLNANEYQSVIEFDQLNSEKRKNEVFNGFQEGEIKFPPTYKYYVGSTKSFNHSKRIPGWCDRILYFSSCIESIKLHQYTSNNDYITSDHKPVSALFTINYEFLDNDKNNINYFTKYNFNIDKWRFIKKVIGTLATRIFGLLWLLFWTKWTIIIAVALIGIFIGYYFIYSLIYYS